ncbi:glutaredoxin domain-containing protein [uncultured Finegoldia sp.]|uniref:glutaredoxin domain-containing protein n=1 Tax=uncultured Finegoldia sp. TaxID=328009 RepID=UPI00261A1270|nr:glutaredoxin domain-containing protein [uncultured Finegoldia sp.]
MKLKLFMSEKCPGCVEAIDKLQKAGIEYEMINITDCMKNLKEFLKFRDNREEFESIKKENRVGIPMITDEKTIVFFQGIEDLRVFNENK